MALRASTVSLVPGSTPFALINPPPQIRNLHVYIKLVLTVRTFNKTPDFAHNRIQLVLISSSNLVRNPSAVYLVSQFRPAMPRLVTSSPTIPANVVLNTWHNTLDPRPPITSVTCRDLSFRMNISACIATSRITTSQKTQSLFGVVSNVSLATAEKPSQAQVSRPNCKIFVLQFLSDAGCPIYLQQRIREHC